MEVLLPVFSVVIGLAIAGIGLWRFVARYEALRQEKLAIAATAGGSKAAVTQAQNQVQTLKGRIDAIKNETAQLENALVEYERVLSLEERERRPAIYIATDALADGRTPFRATVRCVGPTPAWPGQRDYVLWARDIDRARQFFAQRFDPKAGFAVGPVATHGDPL